MMHYAHIGCAEGHTAAAAVDTPVSKVAIQLKTATESKTATATRSVMLLSMMEPTSRCLLNPSSSSPFVLSLRTSAYRHAKA